MVVVVVVVVYHVSIVSNVHAELKRSLTKVDSLRSTLSRRD